VLLVLLPLPLLLLLLLRLRLVPLLLVLLLTAARLAAAALRLCTYSCLNRLEKRKSSHCAVALPLFGTVCLSGGGGRV
jgi:hypothetical protein